MTSQNSRPATANSTFPFLKGDVIGRKMLLGLLHYGCVVRVEPIIQVTDFGTEHAVLEKFFVEQKPRLLEGELQVLQNFPIESTTLIHRPTEDEKAGVESRFEAMRNVPKLYSGNHLCQHYAMYISTSVSRSPQMERLFACCTGNRKPKK